MSPILVRPVREQFEHDRVIRVLQIRYKKKYEVVINPGPEQNASIGIGDLPMFPDLVLYSLDKARKVQGTVEVETGESINQLEAMAQWGPFSRLKTPFFLYIPASSLDTARRLCAEHGIAPTEIWTYHTAIDQVRFTMVHRAPEAARSAEAPARSQPPGPSKTPARSEKPAAAKVAVAKTVAKAPAAKVPAGKAPAAKPSPAKAATKAAAARKAPPPRPAARVASKKNSAKKTVKAKRR